MPTTSTTSLGVTIDVERAPQDQVRADQRRTALVADVRAGLGSRPWTLPPKWLYDAAGSELFDAITRLEEYYPTEAERRILLDRAGDIVAAAGSDTLVELGSGSSDKTTALLDAMEAGAHGLERYVGVDVSQAALDGAARALGRRYAGVRIDAVVRDFDDDLSDLLRDGRSLVAFLGGTIGNYEPGPRARFLRRVAAALGPDDTFLLGTDLVKDEARLVAAYDDRDGVTAAFDRNVLRMLNRELGADFDLGQWQHRAVWDAEQEWIEMHLVARTAATVTIPDVGLTLDVAAGDHIRTEVSAKFRPQGLDAELAHAGLATVARWTDEADEYAVTLARRA